VVLQTLYHVLIFLMNHHSPGQSSCPLFILFFKTHILSWTKVGEISETHHAREIIARWWPRWGIVIENARAQAPGKGLGWSFLTQLKINTELTRKWGSAEALFQWFLFMVYDVGDWNREPLPLIGSVGFFGNDHMHLYSVAWVSVLKREWKKITYTDWLWIVCSKF
jgi:hypothetical protein